ncbi:MAG: YCF48-related protein [Pseudomonadota bacterium]
MRRLENIARGLGAAALAFALLFGAEIPVRAAAGEQAGGVVTLAYDSGTQTLFKAYARALYQSSDGGRSWQKTEISALQDGRIASVAVSPATKGVMYIAGSGIGVLRTEDGGNSWIERDEGLPGRDVIAVAAHATQPDTVYAVVRDQGVYRSEDAGKSWRLMERGSQGGIRQLIHTDMPGSMQTGWLFAATPKGIRRNMDCFCLWQDAGKLGTEAYSVTYDPGQPDHIFAATAKGILRSTDGGENWVEVTSPGANAIALAFSRAGTLYAFDDAGMLFLSTDQGGTWNPVNA